MANSNISKIIEGNWDQLKGKVKKNWGKLTQDDLSVIEGSYNSLVGKIKETYGYTAKEAEAEINDFFSQLKNDASDFSEHSKNIAYNALETLNESMKKCQDKLVDLENVMTTFVKENPVKITGLALLTGLIAGKLLSSKK